MPGFYFTLVPLGILCPLISAWPTNHVAPRMKAALEYSLSLVIKNILFSCYILLAHCFTSGAVIYDLSLEVRAAEILLTLNDCFVQADKGQVG